jgi:hypothetical protein
MLAIRRIRAVSNVCDMTFKIIIIFHIIIIEF